MKYEFKYIVPVCKIRITSYNVCYTKLLRAIAIYISKEESRDLSTEPTGSFYGSIKQNPENQDTNMKKENTFLGKFFRGLLGIAVVSYNFV